MAAAAGIADGDTLVSVDDRPVRSPAELQVALRAAGDAILMRFERAGQAIEKRVAAVRAPTEDGVLYDAVARDGVRLRTMLGRVAGAGRRPAVLFVQGLSVSTMDFAFLDLFAGLRDEGFVTMRVEKRGVGDSEGEAPDRGDFLSEVDDARAALDALTRYDFVDPEAVFVLGHSVGGMIAPLLDAGHAARGIVVYGSSAEPWFECVEAGARRQSTLRGDADVEALVLASGAELRTQLVIDGRSRTYHEQLHDAPIADAWSRVNKPVLVLHGEYDWVVGAEEGQRIAALAGGTFRTIPRLDHLWSAHDSLAASLRDYGKGCPDLAIVRETCAWMRSTSRVRSA